MYSKYATVEQSLSVHSSVKSYICPLYHKYVDIVLKRQINNNIQSIIEFLDIHFSDVDTQCLQMYFSIFFQERTKSLL